MPASLTTSDNRIIEEPTPADLEQALDALFNSGDAEADLWLEDDDGWTLSVVTSGDIFFENINEGDNYQTLGPLERDDLLRLLTLLAQGKLRDLHAELWEAGE
jgi:hypothetical protein